MSRPDDLGLRLARATDVPAIAALRAAVGWGVHAWALEAVVELPEARCFVLDGDGGELIGVGSGIAYGPLGVVGNMIVAPSQRRRGIGAAILEAVVAFLRERGCVRLELSATELGRPLYARHGFSAAGRGTSVVVPRRAIEATNAVVRPATGSELGALAAYDAPRFGGDRSGLMRRMLADAGRPILLARQHDELRGWAWVRPDAGRIGPLVADDPETAMSLLADGLRRMPSAESVRLNLPPGNAHGRTCLERAGAELEPWDGRMALGPPIPRREETLYGSAVGALG